MSHLRRKTKLQREGKPGPGQTRNLHRLAPQELARISGVIRLDGFNERERQVVIEVRYLTSIDFLVWMVSSVLSRIR